MPPRKSISELRRELRARESELTGLRLKRAGLARQLARLDKMIASLAGGKVPVRRKKRTEKRAAKKTPKTFRRARRRARGKPLLAYIRQVLAKAPKGMRTKDIAKAVVAAGYRSSSKNFYGIVAKTVLEDTGLKRVARGVYTLGK